MSYLFEGRIVTGPLPPAKPPTDKSYFGMDGRMITPIEDPAVFRPNGVGIPSIEQLKQMEAAFSALDNPWKNYSVTTSCFAESDPNGKDPNSPGAKLDSGKPLVWQMVAGFSHALSEVARVHTKGAEKYTPNGFLEVPDGERRYMDAFGRHMLKLGQGEEVDPDTGCLHRAQMAWNLLCSLELRLRSKEKL